MTDDIELNPVERLECRRVAERLAPFYETTNWKWSFSRHKADGTIEDVMRVPTESEIERSIAGLALDAIRSGKDRGAYSGGLRIISTPACAENNPDDPNDPDNHVRFFVTVCP